MQNYPRAKSNYILLSVFFLIGANIFPLFAVLFMGWDVYTLLFLYLAETAVIGVFGILKLIIVAKFWALFVVPMFAFACGMTLLLPLVIIGGLADSHFKGLNNMSEFMSDVKTGIIAYLISHGISFIFNYIGKKEYKGMTAETQMSASFQRIGWVFISALGGAFLYIMRDAPFGFMIFILIFLIPIMIIYLAKRIKEKRKAPAMEFGEVKPKITKKKILVTLGSLGILGVLLIAPAVSILVFLIAAKTALDLRSHLKEHKTKYPLTV